MDLDSLNSEFQKLKRRVEPMVREYEAHVSDRRRAEIDVQDRGSSKARALAQDALEAGNLEEAGNILNLSRSHGGDEPDDSYGRRLKAQIHGAEVAEATDAREPAAEAEKAAEG